MNACTDVLYACTDVLFTVLKIHFVAATCKELGIESPSALLSETQSLGEWQQEKDIHKETTQVLERCGVVEEPLIRAPVQDTKDGIQIYAHVFCHHTTLALEFTGAWSMGV